MLVVSRLCVTLPHVLNIESPMLQDVPGHARVSHGHERPAAQHEVRQVAPVEIGHDHSSPFLAAQLLVLASYLPNDSA